VEGSLLVYDHTDYPIFSYVFRKRVKLLSEAISFSRKKMKIIILYQRAQERCAHDPKPMTVKIIDIILYQLWGILMA
jgi:hypothetical protein